MVMDFPLDCKEENMFCSQCGKKLPDGAKFCNYCGFALQPSSKNNPIDQRQFVADQAASNITDRNVKQSLFLEDFAEENKRKSPLFGVIVVVLAILAVGAISISYFVKDLNAVENAIKKVYAIFERKIDVNDAADEASAILVTYSKLQDAYYAETKKFGSLWEIGFSNKKDSYFDYGELKNPRGMYISPKKSIGQCTKGQKISIYPVLNRWYSEIRFECKIDPGCETLASVCK